MVGPRDSAVKGLRRDQGSRTQPSRCPFIQPSHSLCIYHKYIPMVLTLAISFWYIRVVVEPGHHVRPPSHESIPAAWVSTPVAIVAEPVPKLCRPLVPQISL